MDDLEGLDFNIDISGTKPKQDYEPVAQGWKDETPTM